MQNIEIKTPIDSIDEIEQRLAEIGAENIWTRRQTDTFFEVTRGWLKMREAEGAEPELISYSRPIDDAGPRPSTYDIGAIHDSEMWKRLLGRVLDADCVVNKIRSLWIWQHTRIHLDVVDMLGTFLELETVAREISLQEAHHEANQMIDALHLNPARFIAVPYREMLRDAAI